MNEDNNEDVKRAYELSFMTKHQLGQPVSAYDQFRSTAGQFCRICISLGVIDKMKLCEEGELFRSICCLKSVQAFLAYFQLRSAASTVGAKARHLRRLALHGINFFTGKNEVLRGQATAVSEFLRGASASYKTASRQEARRRKDLDERIERMTMLLPEDFSRFLNAAGKELLSIMRTARMLGRQMRVAALCREILKRKGLLEKCCLNLVVVRLLSGGQRPQVYGQLQVPSPEELERMKSEADSRGFFELATVMEKTTRSPDLANVIFPTGLLKYIQFHVEVMRPSIFIRCGATELVSARNRSIFLDPRSARPLVSRQVTHSLRQFLKLHDPELRGITTMSIRGSYASMMIQAFQRQEIFSISPKENFSSSSENS